MRSKFHIYHLKYFKREAKQFLYIFQPQQTRIQSVHIQKQHYGLYSNVKRHLLCSYLLPIKTQPQTGCRGADVGNQQVPSPSPYLAFVQNMHFGRKRGLNLHIVSSAQFTLFVPRMVSHPKPSGRWYLPPCPRLPGCAVLVCWPAPPSCPAFIVPVPSARAEPHPALIHPLPPSIA